MYKRVHLVRSISLLSTLLLLSVAAYFLLLHNQIYQQAKDQELHNFQWPEKLTRLRQRSGYHDWKGSSSEWMKRSQLGRFLFVFSDGDADPQEAASIRQSLKALAKQQWPEPLNFVTVTSKDYITSFHNIVGEDFLTSAWPGALVLDVGVGFKKYYVSLRDALGAHGPALKETLPTFLKEKVLDKYFAHTLDPYLRNEILEVENDDGRDNLKHINSTFFHQVLLRRQAEQEFMIVFYAPWCGHCRRFESAFTPLAAQVRQTTRRIGFYKMDATKNDIDHPEISLLRVPYIRFFRAKDNFRHPIAFDHRTEQLNMDMLKRFFTEHSEFRQDINRIPAEEL